MSQIGAELVFDEGVRAADIVLAWYVIARLDETIALACHHQALVHGVQRGHVALAFTAHTLLLFDHHEQTEHAELIEQHAGWHVLDVAVHVVHLDLAAHR